MARTTYYVVIAFVRNDEGDLFGREPVECQGSAQAVSKARKLAEECAGAIAFSRSGDPNLGDFDDAVELARFGDVPDDQE